MFDRKIFVSMFLTVVGLFAVSAFGVGLPAAFQVIPEPTEFEIVGGAGLEYGQLKSVKLAGKLERPVMGAILTRLPDTDWAGAGVLSLEIKADGVPSSVEGYVLTVGKGRATVASRGKAGLFYGCVTLEQMLEDARDTGTVIPACKITDYPALPYRAVHFDVKHHLDTMKYYYDSIDRLARYKINAIIFEFEDKLRYQRQPLVGAPQAISIDEMAALTNYARERNIEISPLVQGLGHATFILKHDKYAYLRENKDKDKSDFWNRWAFCPLHEGTYQVLFDLYRDAMEATPGAKYLHIGGDEVGQIGRCSRCKPTAEKEGVFGLNLYWLNRVCDFVTEHGRVPIFWDDMPLNYAGVYGSTQDGGINEEKAKKIWEKGEPILNKMLSKFPKSCVYMRWNYSLAKQFNNIRTLEWYKKSGLKAMIATAAQNTSMLMPVDDRVNVIQSFNQVAAEQGIDGMLCTAWDDASPHMETYWRGLVASGEFSWSPQGRSLPEYETAYLQRELGPDCIGSTKLYSQLWQGAGFWQRALGERYSEKAIELPSPDKPGQWSEKYKKLLAESSQQLQLYEETSKELAQLSKKALRNRYQLEILTVTNDFQITSAQLLTALKDYDSPRAEVREKGVKKVLKLISDFEQVWNRLESVYSKTRFIAYPENYVKDRYFHLASKREDLGWLRIIEDKIHKELQQRLESE